MKHFLLLFFIGIFHVSAQVGIGTTNPSAASMLEISSESSHGNFKGLMPPRVTVAQRDLIGATVDDTGLMVFVYDADATILTDNTSPFISGAGARVSIENIVLVLRDDKEETATG